MHLYIDNPDGKVQFQFPIEGPLSIALQEISYIVGYYNITSKKGNNTVQYTRNEKRSSASLPDGLYIIDAYEQEIRKVVGSGISITPQSFDGKAIVWVKKGSPPGSFSDQSGVLGFPPEANVMSGYQQAGTKPVDFLSPKQLFVHCPQIKGDENLYNGKPCDILEVLPVTNAKFGHVVTQRIHNPSFKAVAPRSLHELSLHIKDEEGSDVDFHGQYIRYSLLLRNEHLRTSDRLK